MAGHRNYHDVYNENGLYDHYITGAYPKSEDDKLDNWICGGSDFDGYYENGEFVVELLGYEQYETPKDIQEWVLEHKTNRIWTSGRGLEYEAEIYVFANNKEGISVKCNTKNTDKDPFMWKIKKTGRGKSFMEAIEKAFESENEEIFKEN